jgi:hypothetical protein
LAMRRGACSDRKHSVNDVELWSFFLLVIKIVGRLYGPLSYMSVALAY